VYFNVNFNVCFKLIKVHLLVSELHVYQNARCNDKNKNQNDLFNFLYFIFSTYTTNFTRCFMLDITLSVKRI